MKPAYFYNTVITCDIETSGLDVDKAEVFSVALIVDYDTAYKNAIKVNNLPFVDIVIVKPTYEYFEPIAIAMNAEVIKEANAAVKAGKVITSESIEKLLLSSERPLSFKEQLDLLTSDGDSSGKRVFADPTSALYLMHCFSKYVKEEHVKEGYDLEIAGKNPGKFDIPVLRNFFDRTIKPGLFDQEFLSVFSYRYLEIGSMFRSYYGKQVSLGQITKLFGKEDVEHKAYADVIDSVKAIRLATLKSQHPETSLEDLAKEVG